MATIVNSANAMTAGALAYTVPAGTRCIYARLRGSGDLKYAINQTIATAYFTIPSGVIMPIQCIEGDTINFAYGAGTDVVEIQPVRADAMFDIDKRPVEG